MSFASDGCELVESYRLAVAQPSHARFRFRIDSWPQSERLQEKDERRVTRRVTLSS